MDASFEVCMLAGSLDDSTNTHIPKFDPQAPTNIVDLIETKFCCTLESTTAKSMGEVQEQQHAAQDLDAVSTVASSVEDDGKSQSSPSAADNQVPTIQQDPPPKRFLDLPLDLQDMIISYIVRPTDLVNVCLTCGPFHELAVKYLYKTIELDVGGDNDEHLPAMLNPSNIGVQHIREIELYRADLEDKSESPLRQSQLTIRMLLEMLPRDQLTILRWHPWDVFSAENMVLLFRKQRRLEWIGAIRLDKPIDDTMLARLNLDAVLSKTRRLGLYPDSLDTMRYCNEVLKRVPKPDKITIHTSFDSDEDLPTYLPNLNDNPIEAGLLTRTLFSHLYPFHKCTPMTPNALTLERVNLRYCTETWAKVVDFSMVEKLAISMCAGADALFAALCHSSRLPKRLTKLEFKHDEADEECAATTALETFMCLVSGISQLTLDIGGSKRLPSSMAINRHSKTLTLLNCHFWQHKLSESHSSERVFDRESFEKITKACRRLEQLSIAFPETYIGRTNTDAFDAFSLCIGNLPELVTCNLTTWPQNKSIDFILPRRMYEQLLWAEAQEGFESSMTNAKHKSTVEAENTDPSEPRFTTSKLRVIAWGISDKIFEREDSRNMLLFVRGQQVDPFGGPPKWTAVKMSMKMVHYWEPKTEVLFQPLSRSLCPPVKENEDVDDWD